MNIIRRKQKYHDYFGSQSLGRLDEIIAMQRGVISNHLHLVASACYPFPSVLKAQAEPSTLLPVEGIVGERYLPGAAVMDIVEAEGEQLLLNMFSDSTGYRVSLQPHSGTQANQIVYNAVLTSKDEVLCLKPSDGGHISHTVLLSRRNKTYNFGLREDGYIDYELLEMVAQERRPKLIIVGGSSLPRMIDFARCSEIARKVNAFLHADISHTCPFIIGGLHTNIFPYCDFATFNMMKNLRGPNSGVVIYREDFHKKISRSIFPDTQGGANEPCLLAKYATILEWQHRDIAEYAHQIVLRSQLLAETFKKRGVKLVTDGSDCHILLLDLACRQETGAELEKRFEDRCVLLNKNQIPGDLRGPSTASGLRIGTTNLAILGIDKTDTERLGNWICDTIENKANKTDIVRELLHKYPQPTYLKNQ